MDTIREWLTEAGFDWDNGVIVHQPTTGYSPGWSSGDDIGSGFIISRDAPILDHCFDGGYGSPQCPRFFARDSDAIYFPVQYDGATWLERIEIDPEAYTGTDKATPYPGG